MSTEGFTVGSAVKAKDNTYLNMHPNIVVIAVKLSNATGPITTACAWQVTQNDNVTVKSGDLAKCWHCTFLHLIVSTSGYRS